MIDEEKQKKLINKAKEIFGITESCNRAGYILPNGEMLNFGNPDRKFPDDGIRFQDHSEVWKVYSHFPEIKKLRPPYGYEEFSHCFSHNYVDQFLLETGAIRLSCDAHYQMNGQMFQPNTPTKKQIETLEYCNCVHRPTEKIILEFGKCNDEGRYIPKTLTEQTNKDDCIEPIDSLRKKLKTLFLTP